MYACCAKIVLPLPLFTTTLVQREHDKFEMLILRPLIAIFKEIINNLSNQGMDRPSINSMSDNRPLYFDTAVYTSVYLPMQALESPLANGNVYRVMVHLHPIVTTTPHVFHIQYSILTCNERFQFHSIQPTAY